MIKVTEIFQSIQGESSYNGFNCSFLRLSNCNLNCSWCDTKYSFKKGKYMSLEMITSKLSSYGNKLICITGGEPLLQKEIYKLINILLYNKFKITLETNGSLSIKHLIQALHIVMDIKCPSSDMHDKNIWQNINYLKKTDEIKFVIADKNDFDWAIQIIKNKNLQNKNIIFSTVYKKLDPKYLSDWILSSGFYIRMQIQLHKYIWPNDYEGK